MTQTTRLSFDPSTGRYCVDGVLCTLEPKCVQLLEALSEHHGEVVSAEDLRLKVWEGRRIGPGVIPQTMLKLRKALTDDGSLIRSIRNRGYVLSTPIAIECAPTTQLDDARIAPPENSTIGLLITHYSLKRFFLKCVVIGALAAGIAMGLRNLIPSKPPSWEQAPIANSMADPAAAYALASHLSRDLTPSALLESERLLDELSTLPKWRAVALADLARVLVLRHQYDNQPYSKTLLRASSALADAMHLAPDSTATLHTRAVVTALRGDFVEALKQFSGLNHRGVRAQGFAADYAAVALTMGELKLAGRIVESALVSTPIDSRLLLQKAWLTHLKTAPTEPWVAGSFIDEAREHEPGLLSLKWVAILQRLQRREWNLAAEQALQLQPSNAQDGEGLALAILISARQSDPHRVAALLNLYVVAESGNDGRDLCLIWEALAQSDNLSASSSLNSLISQLPQSLPEGLWLRAYTVATTDPPLALNWARQAYELSLQNGALIDLTLPDFGMHRINFYANMLRSVGDQPGLTSLRSTLDAQQQRLRAEGLNPQFAARLSLDDRR